jgi:hypothetical protein
MKKLFVLTNELCLLKCFERGFKKAESMIIGCINNVLDCLFAVIEPVTFSTFNLFSVRLSGRELAK